MDVPGPRIPFHPGTYIICKAFHDLRKATYASAFTTACLTCTIGEYEHGKVPSHSKLTVTLHIRSPKCVVDQRVSIIQDRKSHDRTGKDQSKVRMCLAALSDSLSSTGRDMKRLLYLSMWTASSKEMSSGNERLNASQRFVVALFILLTCRGRHAFVKGYFPSEGVRIIP